jgi:hypothetical protein
MRFESSPLSAKDIVVNLIPGAMILALFLWFLDGFVGMLINLLTLGSGIVPLVVWLVAAYAAGVLLNLLRGFLNGEKVERMEADYAAQLLTDTDPHFSAGFKSGLKERARSLFGEAASGPELFSLCFHYAAQLGAAKRAEALRANAELYRGMLAGAWCGVFVSGLITVKHLILLLLPQFGVVLAVTSFVDYEVVHLSLGIMLLIVSLVAARALSARAKSCGQAAISEVYTGFYSLASNSSGAMK